MKYIDLRSDTVTLPTKKMREAMANAEVGDDVYGDDPTVNKLEALAAKMVNKEAAMFVASGTMGNQLAIMTHTRRGDEILTGEHNHIVVHEVGALAVLSQAMVRTISHENDFIYPEDIRKNVRSNDIHEPKTTLLSMENALSNGLVIPLDILRANYLTAKKLNLNVHLDGARLFNAATSLGCLASDLASCTDSVMFCLSKGLCAPIGSILAGDKAFIDKARKNRKLLGGGMRQAGILAAAGIIALQEMTLRLKEDHDNAKYLGKILLETGLVELDLSRIQINMVFFRFKQSDFPHERFRAYLLQNGVKINGSDDEYRFVTHNDIDRDDIVKTVKLIQKFQ
ncbi:MAG: low-specificity L-threonine aldolase [Erysipelotrichaceae bacterium]|nr:low-specificity L-threonine aldolase [Erysipelotrichaceae bacterium]